MPRWSKLRRTESIRRELRIGPWRSVRAHVRARARVLFRVPVPVPVRAHVRAHVRVREHRCADHRASGVERSSKNVQSSFRESLNGQEASRSMRASVSAQRTREKIPIVSRSHLLFWRAEAGSSRSRSRSRGIARELDVSDSITRARSDRFAEAEVVAGAEVEVGAGSARDAQERRKEGERKGRGGDAGRVVSSGSSLGSVCADLLVSVEVRRRADARRHYDERRAGPSRDDEVWVLERAARLGRSSERAHGRGTSMGTRAVMRSPAHISYTRGRGTGTAADAAMNPPCECEAVRRRGLGALPPRSRRVRLTNRRRRCRSRRRCRRCSWRQSRASSWSDGWFRQTGSQSPVRTGRGSCRDVPL